MKNILIAAIAILAISFTSCKKEEIVKPATTDCKCTVLDSIEHLEWLPGDTSTRDFYRFYFRLKRISICDPNTSFYEEFFIYNADSSYYMNLKSGDVVCWDWLLIDSFNTEKVLIDRSLSDIVRNDY
jgi:hypothetical protein